MISIPGEEGQHGDDPNQEGYPKQGGGDIPDAVKSRLLV